MIGGNAFNSGGSTNDTSFGGKDSIFLIVGAVITLGGCLCCCSVIVIYAVISYLKYSAEGGVIPKPEAGHETETELQKRPKLRVGSSRIALDSDSSDSDSDF